MDEIWKAKVRTGDTKRGYREERSRSRAWVGAERTDRICHRDENQQALQRANPAKATSLFPGETMGKEYAANSTKSRSRA